MRCPWQRPQTSAERPGERREGLTIVGIGALAQVQGVAANRIGVAANVFAAGTVAALARDAQLRDRALERPGGGVQPRVRGHVVTEDAVVVPPRDVPIEHATPVHRPPVRTVFRT